MSFQCLRPSTSLMAAGKKLGVGNIKETDSSEIFKELARREERSRELILFNIDESESNSWNETKTYERTELVNTINKVCDFNESEVVFIRQVGVKTPNKIWRGEGR
jgi:hypothetical protein